MGEELVLTLHGVGTPHDRVPADATIFWVTESAFSALVEMIASAGPGAKRPTIITFDDGDMSLATIALPKLIAHGLKAKVFICAGLIGAPQYLDKMALADVQAAGIEIGTHGRDHRDWRSLDANALDTEIGEARRRIEDMCARPVTKAAVPFGSYDRRVLARLRREHFECVYTSDGGLAQSDAWLRPRCTVDGTWQMQDVERVLSTTPSLRARLRRNAAILYKSLR
jgi:peptidoglycan/xylan/chitin deacetylase (PgdA/CDA1 family)